MEPRKNNANQGQDLPLSGRQSSDEELVNNEDELDTQNVSSDLEEGDEDYDDEADELDTDDLDLDEDDEEDDDDSIE